MIKSFEKGYALIIGVGGDLPKTVDDAKSLAGVFGDPARCAYPPENIQLLTEEIANRESILESFYRLSQLAEPQSTVVVYFSGHGYQISTRTSNSYYLLPFGYNIDLLPQTAISGAEFIEELELIRSQRMLILLDCCHAGGIGNAKSPDIKLTKTPMPPEVLSLLSEGRGRVVIASSQEDERSFSGDPCSIFTSALLESLSGIGVAKKDGYVRVSDLALHAREVVPQRTGNQQHPILHFEHADNFIVSYYAGGSKDLKELPISSDRPDNTSQTLPTPLESLYSLLETYITIHPLADEDKLIAGLERLLQTQEWQPKRFPKDLSTVNILSTIGDIYCRFLVQAWMEERYQIQLLSRQLPDFSFDNPHGDPNIPEDPLVEEEHVSYLGRVRRAYLEEQVYFERLLIGSGLMKYRRPSSDMDTLWSSPMQQEPFSVLPFNTKGFENSMLVDMRSAFHQRIKAILTKGIKNNDIIQGFSLLDESTIEFPSGSAYTIRQPRIAGVFPSRFRVVVEAIPIYHVTYERRQRRSKGWIFKDHYTALVEGSIWLQGFENLTVFAHREQDV